MRDRYALAALLLLGAMVGCAPREEALRIEMRAPADRGRLVRGWSDFETAGPASSVHFCWVEGTSAKIDVGRIPREGRARLRIVGWPFASGGLAPQRMRLWVNSLFLDERTMRNESAEYSWSFPARLFGKESNYLYLVFDRANRPRDTVPGSTDSRELAAAVELVEVVVTR